MVERLFITLLLVAIGSGAFVLFRQWHVGRMQPVTAVADKPTILYFRSENCGVCPTQSRFLAQLEGEGNGRFALHQIDAETEPDKATQYKVFTLPTTILMDKMGQVKTVNYGLTPPHKLQKQLESII